MKWEVVPRRGNPIGLVSLKVMADGDIYIHDGLRQKLGSWFLLLKNEHGGYGLKPATEKTPEALRLTKSKNFRRPEIVKALGAKPGDTIPVREIEGVFVLLRPSGEVSE